MARQTNALKIDMELAEIPGTSLKVSPVAIGTWAIGGWMWGGTDEAQSVSTIRAALEHGINIIDTAPAYGFGRSEEIVGKAIAEGRSRVLIATKVGLQWEGGRVSRNASRARIMREIEDSLRRLRTDYIDIYQVHWPDPLVRIEETAEAMGISAPTVKRDRNFVFRTSPTLYCQLIYLNCSRPPLDDKRIRQALNLATNVMADIEGQLRAACGEQEDRAPRADRMAHTELIENVGVCCGEVRHRKFAEHQPLEHRLVDNTAGHLLIGAQRFETRLANRRRYHFLVH